MNLPTRLAVPSLDGTAWVLSSLHGRTLVSGTTATLRFEGGRATSSDGCNRYSTPYQAAGGKLEVLPSGASLTFGPAAATRKMCAQEGVMEQEQQFLRALETVATASQEGHRLELRRADGALAVSLDSEAAP
jgi:heat shock protein HslJ